MESYQYNAEYFKQSVEKQNREKLEHLKEQLGELKKVNSLEGAKKIIKAMKLGDRNVIFIGDAKCYISDNEDYLRITIDSPTEFISYNFV